MQMLRLLPALHILMINLIYLKNLLAHLFKIENNVTLGSKGEKKVYAQWLSWFGVWTHKPVIILGIRSSPTGGNFLGVL